jgi:hypothetical protein
MASYRVAGHFNRAAILEDVGAAFETAWVGAGHGLAGYPNNVRTAVVGGTEYAFVSAGAAGIHIVEVGDLRVPFGLLYRATIDGTTLGGGTELAGDRSDALAIVDGAHLVSAAIGSSAVDANGNGITVFDIAAIDSVLQGSPPYDFQSAVLSRTGAGVIAVPGVSDRGGGVAGDSARFVVATGGTSAAVAAITAGSPGSWEAQSPLGLAVAESYDVVVSGDNAYVSAAFGADYGFVVVDLSTPSVSSLYEIAGRFERYDTCVFAGPGNYALALALLDDVLHIGADDEVVRYDVSTPSSPARLEAIPQAGVNVISVAAGAGIVSVGGDFEQRLFGANALGSMPLSRNRAGDPNRILGSWVREDGTVLCCAGYGGLRALRPSI